MDITLHTIPIKDLVEGYIDEGEKGVSGYGGQLNIRPPFQREFVYKEKERNAVIDSIFKGFPLNVMYWVKNQQGSYELLDGQQRTVSICSYRSGDFSIPLNGHPRNFSNLTSEQRDQFLNYQLQVYICENGTEEEQLNWFMIINIAGAKLSVQELRNAIYTGPWVTDAKRRFAKNNCVAAQAGSKYLSGQVNRQEYLETVLMWCADMDGIDSIESYMSKHQHDENSDREWQYFQKVIAWVKTIFPNYRSDMKSVPWGVLYNKYKDKEVSATQLEEEISRLILDDDVTNKKGIYEYVLSREERVLNIRAFSDAMKIEAYERQHGICPNCKKHYQIEEMHGDHIKPWSKGGKTNAENCQMLCKECNWKKSNH